MTDHVDNSPPESRSPLTEARVVLVTGMSGAGLSRALKSLEDCGFEAVDNLPLSMVRRLLRGANLTSSAATEAGIASTAIASRRIAIGIDNRTRDFQPQRVLETMQVIEREQKQKPLLVFMDCDDDVLIRRFKETRRRHPLAADRPISDGIGAERLIMAPLRLVADLVIDSSTLAPAELQNLLEKTLIGAGVRHLTVTVQSFSYRHGLPREADLVFDVRFLKNPHWDTNLRPLDGREPLVAAYIESDEIFAQFYRCLLELLLPLLPRWQSEGRNYVSIAVGCTGGKHRSVMVAESLAKSLAASAFSKSLDIRLLHRDLGRHESSTSQLQQL